MSAVRGHGHFHGEAEEKSESHSILTEQDHHSDGLARNFPHSLDINMTEHRSVTAEVTGIPEQSLHESHHGHEMQETGDHIAEDTNANSNQKDHNTQGGKNSTADSKRDSRGIDVPATPEIVSEKLQEREYLSINDTEAEDQEKTDHELEHKEKSYEERTHADEHRNHHQQDDLKHRQTEENVHEQIEMEHEREEQKDHQDDHQDEMRHSETHGTGDHSEHGTEEKDRMVCQYDDVAANHYFYSYVKTPVDITIYCFIPFVILLVTNFLIIHAVTRSKRFRETTRNSNMEEQSKRDEDITKMIGMLLSACAMFILTTMPNGIYLSLPSVPHEVSLWT